MIFTKEEAQRIAAGRKTLLLANIVTEPLTGLPRPLTRYKVGEDFGVASMSRAQARRLEQDEELCRVLVTSIDRIRLADLDFKEARAMGYRTTAAMAADWMLRYDPQWPPLEEALCDVCDGDAQLEDGSPCPNRDCDYGAELVLATWPDSEITAAFYTRHGQREVWAVRFEIPAELPRLLALPRADRAYTTKPGEAIVGEPEAVDEVWQARITRDAREHHQDRAAADRAREEREIDRRVTALLLEFGIPASDTRTRARARDAVVAGLRRQARRAA